MLDMYDFENDIWLCHSIEGQCFNVTSFVSAKFLYNFVLGTSLSLIGDQSNFYVQKQPAINVLKEIESFMEANPSEIITIFIEDYVTSTNGLSNVFNASGLTKYWFPVSRVPKDGGEWPTVDDMVQNNQRLVVFTSKSSKEASEGIAYQWTYVVENQCE